MSEGTRLADRYTLIRRLGSGGMSEVWLARDRQTESVVALKFVSGAGADAAARERLRREWQIGSRLMHAHILRIFEFHDDPEGAFYSMQYVGGVDLGALAGTPPDNLLPPIALVADALRYAHAKGVVHRDIKASNVLLDARGAPYLTDFGVASLPAVDAAPSGGSPIAMAPGRRAGGPARPADDIYALGVVICELLSGAPPGESRPLRLEAPETVKALLEAMLADDPDRRPDAAGVALGLADAGYPAAPARNGPHKAGELPAATAADVAVATVRPVHPGRAPARAPAMRRRGVPAALVYGGLAGLLALFLVVIFLLPEAVQEPPAPVAAGEAADTPGAREATGAADETAAGAAPEDDIDELLGDYGSDYRDTPDGGETAGFSENIEDLDGSDAARLRAATDEALGDLLSRLERLRYRAVDRWGGQAFLDALNVYAAGDQAYLNRNYASALRDYREAIRLLDPFFDRIDKVFRDTLAAAREAFERGDHLEAVRLYDLAVAITPGNAEAEAGLERARNLEAVMDLTEQGWQYEKDLELEAARLSFAKAIELDPAWAPATNGLERVRIAIRDLSFNQHMTEGLDALAAGHYASARAAFNAARALQPDSRQPLDGLQQVDLEERLANIRRLEEVAGRLERDEQWDAAVGSYRELLEIDGDLQFAKEGLSRSAERVALHRTLEGYIENPDSLSSDVNMQNATRLLLDISRMSPTGPRLEDQKAELSRLLKRAATPLNVQLVSDNMTDVSVYKVGRFGTFAMQELSLRPGTYVAVGSRPGFRDVRLEFRVAPEIEMKPIVIQCEERI